MAAAWLGSVVTAAVVGWWGAIASLSTPDDPLEEVEPTTYLVIEGEVGRSVALAAFAEWPTSTAALNQAAGIVTTSRQPRLVNEGDILYAVNERPTVVGRGEVPAYRDIALGDVGEDVRQLRQLLSALGFSVSSSSREFDSPTEAAVRQWQSELGLDDDGVIRIGDVVWIPSLPAHLALGDGLRVGERVTGGEPILAYADRPLISIPVGSGQREEIPERADVELLGPSLWRGVVAEARPRDTASGGGFDLIVLGNEGQAICAEECGLVPVGSTTEYRADVTLVPTNRGPVVPASAVVTRPDGSAFVVSSDGEHLPVTVLGAQGSIVLVEGVELGTEILVFGVDE